MKNGTTKFLLHSNPNSDEYCYMVLIKSYSGKLWETFDCWTAYADSAVLAKHDIINRLNERQDLDNILSDIQTKDEHGNFIFVPARTYFISQEEPISNGFNSKYIIKQFPNSIFLCKESASDSGPFVVLTGVFKGSNKEYSFIKSNEDILC